MGGVGGRPCECAAAVRPERDEEQRLAKEASKREKRREPTPQEFDPQKHVSQGGAVDHAHHEGDWNREDDPEKLHRASRDV